MSSVDEVSTWKRRLEAINPYLAPAPVYWVNHTPAFQLPADLVAILGPDLHEFSLGVPGLLLEEE
jgi:hypothetical protein